MWQKVILVSESTKAATRVFCIKRCSWKCPNVHSKTSVLETVFDKVSFYYKDSPTQLLSWGFCKIFKNTYFKEHLGNNRFWKQWFNIFFKFAIFFLDFKISFCLNFVFFFSFVLAYPWYDTVYLISFLSFIVFVVSISNITIQQIPVQ